MHLIILPGNSKEFNEQWLYDSEAAYKDMFDSVTTHVYDHWKSGEANADEEAEIVKLEEEAGKLDGEYVIFAKSVGTLITVSAVSKEKVMPKKCIFLGSPWGNQLEKAFNKELAEALAKYAVPTLFIQQTDDMFLKCAQLEEVINGNKVKDYKLIEIPGSNHAYDNYADIKQWVQEFLEA